MTITSWFLEFLTGIITLVNAFFFAHDASLEITTQVLVAIHVFLYFIVIPGSYILSTEVYKNLIFENGWGNLFPCLNRRQQVARRQQDAPEPKDGIESNEVNAQDNDSNEVAAPVPTITGNVNLETSYKVY